MTFRGFRFPTYSPWFSRRTSMVSRDWWLSIMWMIALHWGSILEASDLWQFWDFSQSLFWWLRSKKNLWSSFKLIASVCAGVCNKGHPSCVLSCSVQSGDWKGLYSVDWCLLAYFVLLTFWFELSGLSSLPPSLLHFPSLTLTSSLPPSLTPSLPFLSSFLCSWLCHCPLS